MTLEQIQKAYQEAAQGTETPNCIMIKCHVCKQGFVLLKGKENLLCEHLKEYLNRKLSDGKN